ncbi:50S ribosomal protein L24e [Candidatus Micrarchaeota archaeon CG_4_10_14_0_2_um_filter_55_9]|nr:MAG: 50S ribosomal protein L24e [Candidatus Micrarchaeota archaeon CG09_land_8_20_14_0_10_55_25]PIZ91676.1 MAG: 50S ribosomal protein L24e [Candidatus Micrarchaeota archaeon CG_4_10_14_0_2_um_filter_55_9]PJD01535.1 MAG: 50S ribosomal protein L24e [Candidatus Micrarchaeota archaeon CG10_big_fil_rev_8_21_14_0_10_54_18]
MLGKHCAFCGKKEGLLEGITVFRKDGSSQYYCSRKCRRNAELRRKPRKLKWTRETRATNRGA